MVVRLTDEGIRGIGAFAALPMEAEVASDGETSEAGSTGSRRAEIFVVGAAFVFWGNGAVSEALVVLPVEAEAARDGRVSEAGLTGSERAEAFPEAIGRKVLDAPEPLTWPPSVASRTALRCFEAPCWAAMVAS
jgi:hypothetical protein